MPVFAYRALRASGRAESGVIDAASVRGAWQALRARGVFPTDLAPEAMRRAGRRVAPADLAVATRQLATLVAAGLPVADALEAVAEQAGDASLGRALTLARGRLGDGEPLARALAASPRVFSALYCDVVRAGEASGALATVLERLADHTEATAALRARVQAALTYPAIMTAATGLVLAFLLVWVVPQVAQLFADTGTPLPLATRVAVPVVDEGGHLLGIVTVVRATWWVLLLLAVAAAVAGRRVLASPAGRARLDAMLLRLPLAGRLVVRAAVARFAHTLATLVASGVPVEAALDVGTTVLGNRALIKAADAARAAVRQGEGLAPALARTGIFPSLLVRLAAVGERGGSLAPSLERAARSYEAEVDAAVSAATALLEPILIVVMGAVVLLLVVAVLVPIFTLNQVVR